MKTKSLMWIIAILIMSNTVLAIGLSPARKTEIFVPGETLTYTYYAVNNEYKNMEVQLFANGGLGKYVEFEKETITINENEYMVPFKFTIKLPNKMTEGENTAKNQFQDKHHNR